jgi:hypothetical protein
MVCPFRRTNGLKAVHFLPVFEEEGDFELGLPVPRI